MLGWLGILFGGTSVANSAIKKTRARAEYNRYENMYGAKRGQDEYLLRDCKTTEERIVKIIQYNMDIPFSQTELRWIENAIKSGRNTSRVIRAKYYHDTGNLVEDVVGVERDPYNLYDGKFSLFLPKKER